MYYPSSSGLESKVKNKRTIDAKITSQVESYVDAKIITNWKRKSDRLAKLFRFHLVIISALTCDSTCDVIFASILCLFLTLHSSPEEDR